MATGKEIKPHKQTAQQRKAKELGIRASKNQPHRDPGYTDEDVEFFAAIVPVLAESLDLRRSGKSVTDLNVFAEDKKAAINAQQAKLKRLVRERDGKMKSASGRKKKSWEAPASPILISLFGGGAMLPGFLGESSGVLVKSGARTSDKPKKQIINHKPRPPARNPNLKGVAKALGIDRARLLDTFKSSKELNRLRTKTWFTYLISATSPEAIDQYVQANWLNALVCFLSQGGKALPPYIYSDEQISIPDLKLIFENWLVDQLQENAKLPGIPNNLYERRYELGLETPTDQTLELFERYVPGSKSVYESGLCDVLIWSVLSGDIDACKSFVKEHLRGSGLFQSVENQFDILLTALMPDYEIPDANSLQTYIQSICTGATLSDDLSIEAHPMLKARIESIYAVVENRPENQVYELSGDQANLLETSNGPDSFTDYQIADLPAKVLVAFALLKICTNQRSGPILQLEWLVMGLCCGLYADLFTDDIQEYILNDVCLNGDLLTQHYQSEGISILPFDQRWLSYGLY